MRFVKKYLIVAFGALFVFNSCKNELNILAPYKETVSVYSLLNPQEKLQYVRINKIFLGEGNAYQMAQVSDSINYKKDDLSVTLERTFNGSPALTTVGNPTKMQIVLRDTVLQTASGTFNSTQRLYYTTDKLFSYGEYKLNIKNNKTGNVFTSSTGMIDSIKPTTFFSPICPVWHPVPYAPSNPNYYYYDNHLPDISRKVKFYSVPNAREYAVVMRYHFYEFYTSGDSSLKHVDMNLQTVSSTELIGGELLSSEFYMSSFYSKLYADLSPTTNINLLYRRPVKMDFIVTAGTQEFSDYLKISAPSTSIAQDKPIYTNINGGYGIFSCRSRLHISKSLHNDLIDYMATTKPMCDLRFLNSSGVISSICN